MSYLLRQTDADVPERDAAMREADPGETADADSGAGAPSDLAQSRESRKAFLSALNHELRTPLNSVIGFSEIIAQELHGPIGDRRYKDHARVINDSGLRLLKVMGQVLELARLEFRLAEFAIQAEAPSSAVAAAVMTVSDDAEARGVRVIVDMDPATPPVLADASGLETVLTHLLQQAVGASADGGEVRLAVAAASGRVRFSVAYDGEGVADDDIPRLLHPLQHGESLRCTLAGGGGLGLALANRICDEMGGGLTLRSAPGEGTTATVSLPSAAEPCVSPS